MGTATAWRGKYRARWMGLDGRPRQRVFSELSEAQAFARDVPQNGRTPSGARGRFTRPLAERIAQRITVDANGCWLWQGLVTSAGYGAISVVAEDGAKNRLVHRVAYELHAGPIPDGLVIDHLCRVQVCCNPQHLEPVTSRENTMRSPIAQAALNAAKTHCPQGHPYDEANTYWHRSTGRMCRTCMAKRSTKRKDAS